MEQDQLQVTLLGGFCMRRSTGEQEFELTEQDSTSKRLWTFLQYITVFHQKGVTQDELIDVLWGDGDSANPINTLKTLLHRGRAAVERLGYEDGKQVLLYRRGTYNWNPDIELQLDIEQFDLLCEQAADEQTEDRLSVALRAIELYRGDFLPNAAGNPWAVSLRTYYHNRYIKLCYDTANTLLEQERYEEAVRICQGATMVDPYDEEAHILLMQALSASGAQPAAMQHYTYVTNMLMDQLGVAPSEEMTRLYRELTKADMSMEMDLNVIRDKLLETRQHAGAFLCEYGVFQDIYRLEARSAIRSGRIVQLAMITLLDGRGERLESGHCSKAMETLRGVIQSSLRAGDTFTRFSAAQYLILLPTASYENGVKVLERILNAYKRTFVGMTTRTESSLLPVLPAAEEEAAYAAGGGRRRWEKNSV